MFISVSFLTPQTTSLLKSLKDLDISHNKLDTDTSRLLGVMLAKEDCILVSLHMADTTPVFHRIVSAYFFNTNLCKIDGMTDGKQVKQCSTLKYLDVSGMSWLIPQANLFRTEDKGP